MSRGTVHNKNQVYDPIGLAWAAETQPGGGSGGGGDASAANQTTEITKLTSIDGKLTSGVAVTGTFWQATQPVSGTFWQATQPVSGPLTDTQLRATPVPISGTVTANAGTGPFPVSDNAGSLTVDAPVATPVFVRLSDGAAAIATLPVSLASAPTTAVTNAGLTNLDVALSTRLKPADTLTGVTTVAAVTSITNPVTVTPPTLTKGTQGATGFSTQDLKDSGRVNIAWTALLAPSGTGETMVTLTESRDGAATSTASSKVITSGKRLRITSISMQVENSLGTAIQRAYLRLRVNTAGAAGTSSPQQGIWAAQAAGTVKSVSPPLLEEFPDGFEILGDGTKQIGFSVQAPDWVTASATLNVYLTIFGYEY